MHKNTSQLQRISAKESGFGGVFVAGLADRTFEIDLRIGLRVGKAVRIRLTRVRVAA